MFNIFFPLCYVTKLGKYRRAFCEQTNVATCGFQNEYNIVEFAIRVAQF